MLPVGASRFAAAAACILLGGCGLVLDLDQIDGGGHRADASPDAPVAADAERVGDASPLRPDATATDAAAARPCGEGWLDEGVFATYGFERDLTGGPAAPEGVFHPDASSGWTDGPPGCGEALALDGIRHVVLPSIDAWNEVRSIDFWLLADAVPSSVAGVLSRDASGQVTGGHFSVIRSSTGRLFARVQPADPGDVDEETSCSAAIDLSGWIHVGINVGEPELELWIDGMKMNDPSPSTVGVVSCGRRLEPSPDLSGNSNPWVVGAGAWESADGLPDPTAFPLEGAIDELRFSRSRRAFER